MVKQIVRDIFFLGQPSEPATKADIQVGKDLQDTLQANRERCVGMVAKHIKADKDGAGRRNRQGQKVSITYFVPDAKKAGGSYVTCVGIVKKIDEYEHTIIMTDQTVIPIEQISDIKCEEW